MSRAPKLDASFDMDDLLDICGVQDTPKKTQLGKRKGDIVERRITPVFKKLKLSHPTKPGQEWVFPLPKTFEQLLTKFSGLETAFCSFTGRGRSSVSFEELAPCVQSICRKKFLKMDALRIEALSEYYRVRNMKCRTKMSTIDNLLGVVLMNPEGVALSSILTQKSRQKRKKTFREHVENEVQRQYDNFCKEHDLEVENIRMVKELHSEFSMNRDVKIDRIATKPLPKPNRRNDKRKRMVKKVVEEGKGTRLDSKFIQQKLSQELTKYELLGVKESVQRKIGRAAKKRVSDATRERVIKEAPKELKHLSPTLLVKIQGKEKMKKTLKANPVLALEKKRLEDTIYVSEVIRSICNSCRKATMPYDELIGRVATQHKRFPKKEEIRARINILLEICPEFCEVKKSVTQEIFCYYRRSTLKKVHYKLKAEMKKMAEKVNRLSQG